MRAAVSQAARADPSAATPDFNVAPTKDGNRKLSIYATFDYKRGKSFAGRVLWRTARVLFPEFVHDVVWNHALCTIKEEIEQHDN